MFNRKLIEMLFAILIMVSLMPLQNVAAQNLLEEVVVTARKREESLSDVPISISAITGDQIATSGLQNLEDLSPAIPNFSYGEAVSGNDQVFIRGVGSGVNLGFENAVGQVLNGFFYGRSRFGRAAFLDLEQVEVLKGPQGALIGKNTTAGAVNIRTAMPTDEFEAYLSPTYEFEADDGYTIEGAVSGPLSDAVRGRVAFKYEDRDGWFENVNSGVEAVEREDVSIRAILDFDLSEDLNGNVLYQYGDSNRVGRNREFGVCSPGFRATFIPGGLEDCALNLRNSSNRVENGVQREELTDSEFHIAGLTLNWDVGPGTITSLTGYSQYETNDQWDGDQTPLNLTILQITEDFEQFSQELRFLSDLDGPLNYIAGFYYLHTEQDSHFTVDLLPAGRNRVIDTNQESDTYSLFGQATWEFTEQWDLTVGLRYTYEKKDARQVQFPAISLSLTPLLPVPGGGPFTNVHDISAERTENNLSPNAVLRWFVNEDSMLYASVSRGFKGGGFDHQLDRPQATAAADFQFDKEEVTAYEVGGKFTLADGAAQLNVSIFRSEFDDLQVSSLLPGGVATFAVGNAASAISQGIEADITWVPVENLRLFAAAAYLDAEYDEFTTAPCFILQTVGCDVPAGRIQDLSGVELQYSPDVTFTMNGEYTWQMGSNYQLSLFAQVNYSDGFQTATDNDPNTTQGSYAKVDATLSLEPNDGRWQIALVGRNLTDKLTINFANDGGGGPAAPGTYFHFVESPRALSLQGRINF